MKRSPRDKFYKKPLAVSITAALMAFASSNVLAKNFDVGNFEISFDSTFSVGSSWRVENRNWDDNIGKSNNLNNGFDFSQYNAALNANPINTTIWNGAGAYSNNGDNGNLNYDAGEAFSQIFKGTHELDIRYNNIGIFVRGMYYYDNAMMNSDRDWTNPVSGQVNNPCDNKDAKEVVCQDLRLLDAFIYGDFDLGDMPLSVRVGNQIISWGESTLISHGISELNPVDVARLKAPGAELKEAFIPFGAVWASLGVTDNFNIEAFYQYSWEKTILPPPGSYFSTNDFAGDGGSNNLVQLGFSGNPDIDITTLVAGLNQIGDLARAGHPAAGEAYLAYPTKVTLRAPGSQAGDDPDDGGQYGLRLSWYIPELNDTELSLYYMNYHSRRPIFAGQTANFTAESLGHDVNYLAMNPNITEQDIYDNLSSFSQLKLQYPEDIKLYGLSFNTTVGTTALAGEISYRQDEPLQIDDVELLFAAMPQQLANSVPGYEFFEGISQLTDENGQPLAPGIVADGYILSDTVQAQMTLTHLWGPSFGAAQFVTLLEIGGININDMPEQSDLRLNGPGTDRNGGIASAPGLEMIVQDGVETNPFPTEFAWGYRVIAKLEYTNVFAGININPRVVFSHDVDGITPDPLFLFVEDRKSVALGVNFDYQSRWSADFSYNAFFDGVGTTNRISDRDFVSFSISYSI
ncbi:MAG: DUF1302 domain-containing protein [Colwellia sp.]|nr:DUF1302 domain-containing protein [Colwellia sp.]